MQRRCNQYRNDLSWTNQSKALSLIIFEITGKHIPNQPLNNHVNYFTVLEDDDDETMSTSNISEGYYDEDDIGMVDVPSTA